MLLHLCAIFGAAAFDVGPRLPLSAVPNATCPCARLELCSTPTAQPRRELFGFGAKRWQQFNWTRVTTVAWPGDEGAALVCEAHARGARVISAAPPIIFTPNKAERAAWIASLLASLKSRFLDGVTFDYESPLDQSAGSPTRANMSYYAALVQETTEALHAAIPGSQTSVCVAWSPDDIDGRNYDYPALAAATDLLYVMAYDTRSQIYSRCIASANSPLSIAERGLRRYAQLGVPPAKLVLGTPWYGYSYPCSSGDAEDDVCPIALVPFRGVNCSDAAGSEVGFLHVMNLLDRNVCPPGLGTACAVTAAGLKWDESTQSPYFNYVADGAPRQMWFDNARSSRLKYAAAMQLGARGVGPFTWDDLDADGSVTGNSKAPAEAREMWGGLDVVF